LHRRKGSAPIKNELTEFCYSQFTQFPELFAGANPVPGTAEEWQNVYVSDVKDFHTAGKVSATLGIPITKLPARSSYIMPDGTRVEVPLNNYKNAVEHVQKFVDKLG
jgi:hypothetical protein